MNVGGREIDAPGQQRRLTTQQARLGQPSPAQPANAWRPSRLRLTSL